MPDETVKNEHPETNQDAAKPPPSQKAEKKTPPPKPNVDWLQLIDVTESFKKEPVECEAPFDFLKKRTDNKE